MWYFFKYFHRFLFLILFVHFHSGVIRVYFKIKQVAFELLLVHLIIFYIKQFHFTVLLFFHHWLIFSLKVSNSHYRIHFLLLFHFFIVKTKYFLLLKLLFVLIKVLFLIIWLYFIKKTISFHFLIFLHFLLVRHFYFRVANICFSFKLILR
jgi:hypothetical protein